MRLDEFFELRDPTDNLASTWSESQSENEHKDLLGLMFFISNLFRNPSMLLGQIFEKTEDLNWKNAKTAPESVSETHNQLIIDNVFSEDTSPKYKKILNIFPLLESTTRGDWKAHAQCWIEFSNLLEITDRDALKRISSTIEVDEETISTTTKQCHYFAGLSYLAAYISNPDDVDSLFNAITHIYQGLERKCQYDKERVEHEIRPILDYIRKEITKILDSKLEEGSHQFAQLSSFMITRLDSTILGEQEKQTTLIEALIASIGERRDQIKQLKAILRTLCYQSHTPFPELYQSYEKILNARLDELDRKVREAMPKPENGVAFEIGKPNTWASFGGEITETEEDGLPEVKLLRSTDSSSNLLSSQGLFPPSQRGEEKEPALDGTPTNDFEEDPRSDEEGRQSLIFHMINRVLLTFMDTSTPQQWQRSQGSEKDPIFEL